MDMSAGVLWILYVPSALLWGDEGLCSCSFHDEGSPPVLTVRLASLKTDVSPGGVFSNNGDVIGCEGTVQASSSPPPPPSLTVTPLLILLLLSPPQLTSLSFSFFFSLLFVLAGYSFYSFGITEFKPNSTLLWAHRGTTVHYRYSRYLLPVYCVCISTYCTLCYTLLPFPHLHFPVEAPADTPVQSPISSPQNPSLSQIVCQIRQLLCHSNYDKFETCPCKRSP